MMRFTPFVLLLFISITAFGQFSMKIQGQVTLNDKPLQGAHISNLTSQDNATTNGDGMFVMEVYESDILLVTHLTSKDKHVVIYGELEENPFLLIKMKENTNELDEVFIEDGTRVTVQSVGIVQGEQYIPTTNERRLSTAGDFKAIHLLGLLGGSLPLDPIINAINGRTKRLKRYIEIDGEIEAYESLYYYDAEFLSTRFEIDDEEVKRFLNSLIDHPEVDKMLLEDNEDRIRIWLCEQYLAFNKE